jgi:Myb/SANT-like DNA-binding protein
MAAVIINNLQSWPKDATFTLIQYRRRYHELFEDRSIRDHTEIWMRIARKILQRDNFLVNAQQCKTKWRALKRGYENLRRLFNGNPRGFPIHSPNTYDTRFYNELSDEFWEQTGNYLSSDIKLSRENIFILRFLRSFPTSI